VSILERVEDTTMGSFDSSCSDFPSTKRLDASIVNIRDNRKDEGRNWKPGAGGFEAFM
jgi:hypothetical protein